MSNSIWEQLRFSGRLAVIDTRRHYLTIFTRPGSSSRIKHKLYFFVQTIVMLFVLLGFPHTSKKLAAESFVQLRRRRRQLRTEFSPELGKGNKIILYWAFLWYAAYVLLHSLLTIYDIHVRFLTLTQVSGF